MLYIYIHDFTRLPYCVEMKTAVPIELPHTSPLADIGSNAVRDLHKESSTQEFAHI